MRDYVRPINPWLPDEKNSTRGTERGAKMLRRSLNELGATDEEIDYSSRVCSARSAVTTEASQTALGCFNQKALWGLTRSLMSLAIV